MDPTTAWEHPGFASSDLGGVALAAVKADATLAGLVLWDKASGDTIIRAFGPAGKVKFQTSAGAAFGIAWADVSKVGSSLADLAVRDASALDSGTLAAARLAGAYTGITAVGTLTTLTVSGAVSGVTASWSAASEAVRLTGSAGYISFVPGGTTRRGYIQQSTAELLLATENSANLRLSLAGPMLVGHAVSAGASPNEIVLNTNNALRGVYAGSTYELIKFDGPGIAVVVGHTAPNLILRFSDGVSGGVVNGKVSTTANDSAGAGYRYLRVPNG